MTNSVIHFTIQMAEALHWGYQWSNLFVAMTLFSFVCTFKDYGEYIKLNPLKI